MILSAPPSRLNIIDSSGSEVDSVAGPYLEGNRILLRCLSAGGMTPDTTTTLHNLNIKL